MSERICKALGYAVAGLVVSIVFSLFGAHIFGSVFTTIMVLFGIMALFEGKGKEWLNGRFAASKWQATGAELVVTLVIYTPIALLFNLGWDSSMSFWSLMLACIIGGGFAPFAGGFIEEATKGTRG